MTGTTAQASTPLRSRVWCGRSRGRRRGRERRLRPLLLAAALSAAVVPAAVAQQGLEPQNFYSQPAGISLEQAAARVRRATGGRVLSADHTTRGGVRGYSIRVLIQGEGGEGDRVKRLFVDKDGNIR